MRDHLAKAVASALAGVFVGWAGTALTLASRVSAIEQTLLRIELRMDQVTQPSKGANHG